MAKFKPVNQDCKWCGKKFLSVRDWHEFHKPKCRIAYWKSLHPNITPDVLKDIEKIKKHIGLT